MADASRRTISKFLRTLDGEPQAIPPIWLMRQAGRYLPEYRKTRQQAGSFLDLCYNSELAAEVTMQPIRRYDFDAAILFADILLIPHALGQKVWFVSGEGPRLSPVITSDNIGLFEKRNIHETLSPVYETVRRVRAELADDKALIGFAGAPWTVATYMLAGGPLKDPSSLRQHWYENRDFLLDLIDRITVATIEYLIHQVEAGADAIQLFDTWAGGLPPEILQQVSIAPLARIAAEVRAAHPETPVVLFPKGVGAMLPAFARLEDCAAVGIDYAAPWDWVRREVSPLSAVQGGLDPSFLVHGGKEMREAARALCQTFDGAPYIFNLGHGLTPESSPEAVGELVKSIRGG